MFWVTNSKLDCERLVREYCNKVAPNSESNLIYEFREFDELKLLCVCDFSGQFYENKNYVAFYAGYLSGTNVPNLAETLLDIVDYSGERVRFKREIG